jgi:hypothetical protein
LAATTDFGPLFSGDEKPACFEAGFFYLSGVLGVALHSRGAVTLR